MKRRLHQLEQRYQGLLDLLQLKDNPNPYRASGRRRPELDNNNPFFLRAEEAATYAKMASKVARDDPSSQCPNPSCRNDWGAPECENCLERKLADEKAKEFSEQASQLKHDAKIKRLLETMKTLCDMGVHHEDALSRAREMYPPLVLTEKDCKVIVHATRNAQYSVNPYRVGTTR